MGRHPNALIHGPHDATGALVHALTPFLRLPIHHVTSGGFVGPPPPACRTMILDDVEGLNREQQQTLLGWLDEHASTETQVISITPTTLHARVQDGTFLNALYYRLNVVYLEVSSSSQ